MPLGQFLRYFYGIGDAWNNQGYPRERLQLHAREVKGDPINEFWMLKETEVFHPTPFSVRDELERRLSQKTLFDVGCIACDPAVLLEQGIFNEGL